MAQNFNVRPYYDDYADDKHFYRVLFRPAVAVQARELTQAQTILQSQITKFGNHVFKHGAVVTPGAIATDPKASYVRLEPTYGFLGPTAIPINLDLFADQIIIGDVTQMSAQVVYSTPAENGDSPTLFVKYIDGGLTGGYTSYVEGENLSIRGSATTLATTVAADACGTGASAQIDQGVYYINGFFVRVEKQYLVLDKYNSIVNARIGLNIEESIVTPEDDITLTDNAQGATNYAAPGAHRYKIDLILDQRPLDDHTDDSNFVELVRLKEGIRQVIVTKTEYSEIAKELAKRTKDTNGDFVVRNFAIDFREHLDTSFVTTDLVVSASNGEDPVLPWVILAASASAVNDFYVGMQIYISDGKGAGQRRTITGYVGSTKKATIALGDEWDALKIPNSTSTYIIIDPTLINRGVYPPAPFGPGDANKLAVGLESGRAYVEGFLVDTLVTKFVDMDKSRDTEQANNAVIPTTIGNYFYAKNLYNIPLAASSVSKDYLTISLSNKKATGSFSASTDEVGTARIHAIEYVRGTSQASTDAIFKVFIFDLRMNVGKDVNAVRSFHLTTDTGNNNGNSRNSYGDVLAQFAVASVNGTGMLAGNVITGPNSVGTEKIVLFDAINNVLLTECVVGNTTQILNTGAFTAPNSTTGRLISRTQLFNPAESILIYRMSQNLIKAVRDDDNETDTTYYTRRMFEAQRNGSGHYIFNTASTEPFAPFNTTDYMACVVTSSNSADVGKVIDLSSYVGSGSFTGNPANTVLDFQILSGVGSTAGSIIKLMGTVIKTTQGEKLKTLTDATLAVPSPTSTISLNKADIYQIVSIIDSGDPGVDADEEDESHIDIKSRYNIDSGQRDYYYDVGSVRLLQGAPPPAGRLKIIFKYFAHSGTGDYFSVDSYVNQVDYADISTYQSSDGRFFPLRDCLDFRPRKGDTTNNFAGTGASFAEAVRPNDVVRADFQYYLGRIDKVYVDREGNFKVVRGNSSLTPLPPANPKDGMLLYQVRINPYTLSPKDLSFKTMDNRRYTMADIRKLETRIENLEYYTSLNLLEKDTAQLSISDTQTGLDRFKNGFVVDNFKGHGVGDVFDGDYRCSVDRVKGELRPLFTKDCADLGYDVDASSGFVKRGDILLLPYVHTKLAEQPFACEIVNINPFAIFSWGGDITLIPPTDTWHDVVNRPDVNLTDDTALDGVRFVNSWSGVSWGDWQTDWTGVATENAIQTDTQQAGTLAGASFGTEIEGTRTGGWMVRDRSTGLARPYVVGDSFDDLLGVSAQVQINEQVTSTREISQSRTGIRTSVVPQVVRQTVDDRVVNMQVVPYIRRRRVKVIGRHMKPSTRMYPYFDNVNVSEFCKPFSDPKLTPDLEQDDWTSQSIAWGQALDYSATSVDPTQGGVTGTDTYLAGNLNDGIYTDGIGTSTLFFEIPNSDSLRFRTGRRTFRLTSSPTNADNADSFGDADYTAAGILETKQRTITSVREPQVITQSVSESQTLTESSTFTRSRIIQGWVDPLAETFLVDKAGGCFVSKVDIFFHEIDENIPVTLQIRNVVNGYPGPQVLPFGEKTLYPNRPDLSALTSSGETNAGPAPLSETVINISDDGSVATPFEFDCPVYCEENTEYCIVLLANSVKYTVFTARLGEKVIGSTNIVSVQPYNGVMFKSQNGSTWTADQNSDLKFTIYRAQFDPNQTSNVYITNLALPTDVLGSLPFQTETDSNIVRIHHENHQMPKGANTNSVVTLSNIATGTYNGITSVQLTGTFSIDNVDQDSYTITVGAAAAGTGRVGPDGVLATRNRQYDALNPVISSMVLTQTGINWSVKTTSGKSVHNNALAIQEPYAKDPLYIPIAMNDTTYFSQPRMVASTINETTSIVGATSFDRKSLVFKGIMSTEVENLTPMIDTKRMSAITVCSRLDDPTFANMNIDGMDNGVTVTSTSPDSLSFDSQTILAVTGVTGTTFATSETVTGARRGSTGNVVAFDSVNLTLNALVGQFIIGETISGLNAVGTVKHIQKVNTITNPSAALDFTTFRPGRAMTIIGSPSNNDWDYDNPAIVLSVSGNTIYLDTGDTDFTPVTGQTNVQLTQYNRFVSEVAPTGCSVGSRYITRRFTFKDNANSLKVYFTINRPPGSFIDVYYRILRADTNDVFDTQLWTQMDLEDTVDSGESSNPNEFKEYVYGVDQIGEFTAMSVKLVMRGGNTAQSPRIRDFRAIALGT